MGMSTAINADIGGGLLPLRTGVRRGDAYAAESLTYFAAMSVQPDSTRKGQLNTLIAALKTAGVWTKLDALYIMAAHDAQAARVNAIDPASVATVSGAQVFTADRGYAGDGTASYINTGFNPTTAVSPKYTRDDAHMGLWTNTAVTSSGGDMGITAYAIVAPNVFGNARWYANLNAVISASNSPAATGHYVWTRRASNACEYYRNGVSMTTSAGASGNPVNAKFFLNASNSSTTDTATPANFSANREAAAHWGSKLTTAENLALYNAMNTYLTAVGGA